MSELHISALFTYAATPRDIEDERQRMEAEHGFEVAVFCIEYPVLRGTRMTRVTWARVWPGP